MHGDSAYSLLSTLLRGIVFLIVVLRSESHQATAAVPGEISETSRPIIGQQTGVKVCVSQKGAAFVAVESQLLNKLISTYEADELTQQFTSDNYLRLRNASVTRFESPTYTTELHEPDIISKAAAGGKISFKGAWEVNLNLPLLGAIHRHGKFRSSLENRLTQIYVRVESARNNSFRPSLKIANCTTQLGKFHFHSEGLNTSDDESLSDLLNQMINHRYLNLFIRQKLQNIFCEQAKIVAHMISSQLGNYLPTIIQPRSNIPLVIDYSLTEPISIHQGFLCVHHSGVFGILGNTSITIDTQPSLPSFYETSDRMVYVQLSERSVNSLLDSLFRLGLLHYEVTQQSSGAYSPYLATTCAELCIGVVSKDLGTKYPNEMVELDVAATAPPHFDFSPSGSRLTAEGSLNGFVLPENATANLAASKQRHFLFAAMFKLQMTVKPAIKKAAESRTIVGNVTIDNVILTLQNSTLQDLSSGDLQDLIDLVLYMQKLELQTAIDNQIYANGFVIPLPEMLHFVDPIILVQERVILVKTDLSLAR